MSENKIEQTETRSPGRPLGSLNAISQRAISAVIDVYDRMGGPDGLYTWAISTPYNRTEFYRIWAKLLPKNINFDLSDREKGMIIRMFNGGAQEAEVVEKGAVEPEITEKNALHENVNEKPETESLTECQKTRDCMEPENRNCNEAEAEPEITTYGKPIEKPETLK